VDTPKRTWNSSLALAILSLAPIVAIAGQPYETTNAQPSTSTQAAMSPAPWVSPTVASALRSRLEASYRMATQRLQESAECRGLFSALGADGLEALASTMYYPATVQHERQVCGGAHGYTVVGWVPTYLCRNFVRLSERRGALVLIHEALHRAGMGEWPGDANALSSGEINDLVAGKCGF
jgi:hypothetical protein